MSEERRMNDIGVVKLASSKENTLMNIEWVYKINVHMHSGSGIV